MPNIVSCDRSSIAIVRPKDLNVGRLGCLRMNDRWFIRTATGIVYLDTGEISYQLESDEVRTWECREQHPGEVVTITRR